MLLTGLISSSLVTILTTILTILLKEFFSSNKQERIKLANEDFVKIIIHYMKSKQYVSYDALKQWKQDIAICYRIKLWKLCSIKEAGIKAKIEYITTNKFPVQNEHNNIKYTKENFEIFYEQEKNDNKKARIRYFFNNTVEILIVYSIIIGAFYIVMWTQGISFENMSSWGLFFAVILYTTIGVGMAYVIQYIIDEN